MKPLWCWRCKMYVPMLDEEEYAQVDIRFKEAFKLKGSLEERFQGVTDYYNELTGWDETNPNAIMHHRIALYGPPCEACGKPYRTPKASFCAACGHKRPGYPKE